MSRQDEKIAKHIHQKCLEAMDQKEFLNAVYFEIQNYEMSIDPPSESTIYRWYNGEKVPSPEFYPIISKVLNISENEIRAGVPWEPDAALQEEIDKLEALKNASDEERSALQQAAKWKKYNLRLMGVYVAVVGLFFLNITLWKNPWAFLVTFGGAVLITKFDDKKNQKEHPELKREKGLVKSFKNRVKDELGFVKFITQDNLISKTWALIMILILTVGSIPLIETLFYGGKYYTTCVVCFGLSLLLLVKSISRH